MKQFGTLYSGFFYPATLPSIKSNSVIYCFGAGEDISHDIELAHKTGATVHIFDPTPRAMAHVQQVQQVLLSKKEPSANKRVGGGDPNYWKRIIQHPVENHKIRFYEYGLYTEDNPKMKFYMPSNPEYVSHSLVEGMKSSKYIEVPVKSLETIMKELGHTHIDLLKLDIEGCECDVLEYMIQDSVYPTYVSVDFDLGWTGENRMDRERCFQTIALLERNGYEILHQAGPNISFFHNPYKKS
jgi:FkbM family methyltransferase